MNINGVEGFLSISDSALLLKVTPEAVRQLVERGTLSHVRRGGRNWIPRSAVDLMLEDDGWRGRNSRRPDRG